MAKLNILMAQIYLWKCLKSDVCIEEKEGAGGLISAQCYNQCSIYVIGYSQGEGSMVWKMSSTDFLGQTHQSAFC